jgi:hypothetical protein
MPLHRLHDAKREFLIYDYRRQNVPVLARMAAERRIGYQVIGYRLAVAAHAGVVGSATSNSGGGRVARSLII